MQSFVIKLLIFSLTFSGIECFFGIIEKTSKDDKLSRLAETAVTSLLSCYEKDVTTVGAVGISEPIIHKILSEQIIPVISIANNTARASVNDQTVDNGLPHKLQLFVVEASSWQTLNEHFQRVKSSKWWNHMATYLIIDLQSQNSSQGCSNVIRYLSTAWIDWHLLNVLYVCLKKQEEKVLVYSFNPYTSQAPAPWRKHGPTYMAVDAHPWSVFVREYRPVEQDICINLNFVKTHDLGGYKIVCLYQSDESFSFLKTIVKKFWNEKSYPSTIMKALNATPVLTLLSTQQDPGTMERQEVIGNITIKGNLKVYSSFDMTWSYVPQLLKLNYHCSSRIINDGLAILTQYRGQMSQLDKIIGVLDKATRIGLCLVALKTVLFFKFFMRQPLGSAILNVIRIIANSSLVKVPEKVAPRLYLTGVFILVVTIIGIYQGEIASLLTNPKSLPNVDTMEDLINSPHIIHGLQKYAHIFKNSKLNGRFVGHSTADCDHYVIQDPLAACVDYRLNLLELAIYRNLHLSRDTILPMNSAYAIGPDWPVEDRLNEIITTFTEAHIEWYIHQRELEWKLEKVEYKASWEKNRTDKVIRLSELGFAFAILGIGLGFATVSFIVEITIKEIQLRRNNATSQAPKIASDLSDVKLAATRKNPSGTDVSQTGDEPVGSNLHSLKLFIENFISAEIEVPNSRPEDHNTSK